MCGIAGLIDNNTTSTVNYSLLKKMSDIIIHRGPDSDGQWISEDNKCGFSFRRLSIIDLSKNGNQPMHTPDNRYHIVFNGEIYNHNAIRNELISLGYKYHSNTDTETILYGYQHWGIDILNKMMGMWAIAIWDDLEKKLILARDRIGIKPLYFYHQNNKIIFGSEIKSILQHPEVSPQVNYMELMNLLHYLMSGTEHTLFDNIHKLPSGHFLEFNKNSEIKIHQYWHPFSNISDLSANTNEKNVDEILQKLRDSIDARMMSDVPIGAFLSGGIDSSLNVALMSEIMNRPVDTYTVGFKDLVKYNEFYYAQLIAKRFKTNHHEIIIDQKDSMDAIDKIIWHNDEPNADPVCIPIYYLSKLTKDSGTTVAQVGEGSDEQFFGYDWIIRDWKFEKTYYKTFTSFPKVLRNLVYSISSPLLNRKGMYIISEYIRRAKEKEYLYRTGSNRFTYVHLQNLIINIDDSQLEYPYKMISKLYDEIKRYYPQADQMQKMAYLELRHRLAETLLIRIDKLSMAHSLEARVPFLDHRLVEFTMSLKDNQRLPDINVPKYLLKKAAEKILPHEVIYRKKQGFAAPVKEWLRNEWYKEFYDVIENSHFVKSGLFNFDYIKRIFELHRNNSFNFQNELFILYILEKWYQKFIK